MVHEGTLATQFLAEDTLVAHGVKVGAVDHVGLKVGAVAISHRNGYHIIRTKVV